MRSRNGFTLAELLVALAVVGATAALGTLAMAPALARETMRSTLHDAGSLVQMARVESVRRNRECRFIVNTVARTMSVVDKNGTATTSDDIVLRSARIPQVVSFARPDSGSAITFTVTGSTYTIDLHPDGYVSAGSGEMVMFSAGDSTDYGSIPREGPLRDVGRLGMAVGIVTGVSNVARRWSRC